MHHHVFEDAKVSANVMRFLKLINNQRENSPTVTTVLDNIAEHLSLLRENWLEAVYRNLYVCLAKCYTSAFESFKSSQQADPPIPPNLFSFLSKFIKNMGKNENNDSSHLPSKCI